MKKYSPHNVINQNFLKSILLKKFWLLLIGIMFLFSVFLFIFRDSEEVLYFFPDAITQNLIPEHRLIPKNNSLPDRISQYLYDYILGPENLRLVPFFPPQTEIKAIYLLSNSLLVIDFADSIANNYTSENNNSQLGQVNSQFFDQLKQGIQLNFPRIKEVRFLIEGIEVKIL